MGVALATHDSATTRLRRELQDIGIANAAIDAVWPQWWSAEASESLSAQAELKFTIARRLGLVPSSLFDGNPRFIWRDEARFKSISVENEAERAAITSFGVSVASALIESVEQSDEAGRVPPEELRAAVLRSFNVVDLGGLLSYCWAVGIPVAQLTVFPLTAKRMHAMSAGTANGRAVLLGRTSTYASQAAYLIAHELGHIGLGHVHGTGGIVEMRDPLTELADDEEERDADRYALTVLLGSSDALVESDQERYNASQLADAAVRAGRELRIDPGVLALCLGHSTGRWEQTFGALKVLFGERQPVGRDINRVAIAAARDAGVAFGTLEYLRQVLSAS